MLSTFLTCCAETRHELSAEPTGVFLTVCAETRHELSSEPTGIFLTVCAETRHELSAEPTGIFLTVCAETRHELSAEPTYFAFTNISHIHDTCMFYHRLCPENNVQTTSGILLTTKVSQLSCLRISAGLVILQPDVVVLVAGGYSDGAGMASVALQPSIACLEAPLSFIGSPGA